MFSQIRRLALICVLLTLGVASSSHARPTNNMPPLPKIWHIIWSDQISDTNVQDLKAQGADGLFKCVAISPNYPAGEWRLVETVEGQYNWNDLRRCLDTALQANMWVIPELVINIPPTWFIERYPNSILHDSRGEIIPSNIDAPYLLSPWFVASGEADTYLLPLTNSFLNLVSEYPNVAGVMIGNFLLHNLPWCLGDSSACDNSTYFTYWPIWDIYALSDYESEFGIGKVPPSTWTDYEAMDALSQMAFREWLVAAISTNLQGRYLPWIATFGGWKVVNAPIWDDGGSKASIFTTNTSEMTIIKQTAIKNSEVSWVIINDDNMGDCGLATYHQQDIDLAHSNGFLIFGERVPNLPTCGWSEMYNMWQNFNPSPDGFINITDSDPFWMGQFRTFYGTPNEPLSNKAFLPLVSHD